MRKVAAFGLGMSLLAFGAHAQTSRDGNYLAQIRVDGKAKQWPEANTWQAAVLSKDGRLLYTLVREIPYDNPIPALYLSEREGRSVLVNPADGMIEFYSPIGELTGRVVPVHEPSHDFERVIKCSIAGELVAFLHSESNQKNASLLMTDLQGNDIWRATLPGRHAAEIHLSATGSVVAAGSYNSGKSFDVTTQIFDAKGGLLNSIPQIFRYADIEEQTGLIALSLRNGFLVHNILSNELLTEWITSSREEIVTGIRFVEGRIAVGVERIEFVEGRPFYTEPNLMIFAADGKFILQKGISARNLTPANLLVVGSTARLQTNDGEIRLDLSQH